MMREFDHKETESGHGFVRNGLPRSQDDVANVRQVGGDDHPDGPAVREMLLMVRENQATERGG